MKSRFAFLVVLTVFGAAASAFAQTAVQPADWSAVNSASLQTSGKSLLFEFRDVSRAVRLSIVDMKGRVVWARTVSPVDGVASFAWTGVSSQGAAMPAGVYAARADLVGASRGLMQRTFVHAP